ncbi:hypothetical protein LTR66_004131 [Elasticomyces elasticus]|nr:hypothetical protein LTR66_004131 [Elasticomyces elasticus]
MSDAATSRSSLPLAAARQIILQVGQQRFVTTCETLAAESSFFASLLSGRWDNALVDDSYFIDVDPSLFEHILRYLRRGVLPVFYDMHKGHDYALYLALLEEAKYFQIPRLQEWLENKRYLRALMVECSVEEVEGVGCLSTTRATDEYVEYYPGWGTKKVGKPGACGRDCRKTQGDADDIYEEEAVSRTLLVKKQVVFDIQACLAGW